MKKNTTYQAVLAFTMCMLGMGLLFWAFAVPPMGKIDPSVLTAIGEVLTFAGAVIGIDYHYTAKKK